jgi:hypothetical protein
LLHSPGLGLLSGEPGVGKTAIVHQIMHPLNPHQYQVIYTPETDFGRQDLYRNLALELGLVSAAVPPGRAVASPQGAYGRSVRASAMLADMDHR